MKILIVSENRYGPGAAVAANRLAQGLLKLGNEVEFVFAYQSRAPHWGDFKKAQLKKAQSNRNQLQNLYRTQRLVARASLGMKHPDEPFLFATDYPHYLDYSHGGKLAHYYRELRSAYRFVKALILRKAGIKSPTSRLPFRFWKKRAAKHEAQLLAENARELIEHVKQFKPDVINIHNVSQTVRHGTVAELTKYAPVFWTMHDNFAVKLHNNEWTLPDGALRVSWGNFLDYEKAKTEAQDLLNGNYPVTFVCPSEWLKNQTEEVVRGRKPVKFIRNGISNELFFREDKTIVREKLGLDPEQFYLLFVANDLLYSLKNFQVLVAAMEMIKPLPIKLLAVGKYRAALRKGNEDILFMGSHNSAGYMRRIYNAANITMVPSLIENLPNTVVESLFCGTPVIGSRAGGIPEMIEVDKTGWLIDPTNPSDVANCIRKVYANRYKLEQLENECIESAKRMFDVDTQAGKYLEAFREGGVHCVD